MRVALGQIECVVGDIDANVAFMTAMIQNAAAQGCAAVWFPELADTGYALRAMPKLAGAWPGPAYNALSAAAQKHRIAVGAGLSERVGNTLYNALVVFNAEGQRIGHYRKAHLFAAGQVNEATCFTPASSGAPNHQTTEVIQPNGATGLTHGLSICYDLRFPELYRQRTEQGATVLVNTTAWPMARETHWDILTRARAVENQAYFLGVGRVGTDEGIPFAGRSRVIAPTGEIIAEASVTNPELLVADLDPQAAATFRAAVPALAARRRDLFG